MQFHLAGLDGFKILYTKYIHANMLLRFMKILLI